MNPLKRVMLYHHRTKHHFHRLARSAGYMDWANQPDPFRRFDGAPQLLLPLTEQDDSPPYDNLYTSAPRDQEPLNTRTMAAFFEFSMAISAWKQYKDARWALRCNPSSGNLHPTEAYIVCDALDDTLDQPSVYHYRSIDHALERRCLVSAASVNALVKAVAPRGFLVGLTSVHWRESWKYGERAYRYCQHDVGHALAACAFSAKALGWRLTLLHAPGDAAIAALLGIDRTQDFEGVEPEHPDLLAIVTTDGSTPRAEPSLPENAVRTVAEGKWTGRANRLSKAHTEWPIIEDVAAACQENDQPPEQNDGHMYLRPIRMQRNRPCDKTAWQIIRQRRSAVAMDGRTPLDRSDFFPMLARVMPASESVAESTIGQPCCVDLGLFVHRVTDMTPGVYVLVRDPDRLETLRQHMRPEFAWTTPDGCPRDLPLFLLLEADARNAAATVSCGQDIAGDGAFSLGMIAQFRESLEQFGPWMYRRLFWETGLIGQILYLEAEAAGLRSTGIGCFFDDPVHQIFGLTDDKYQSLYHFTVGGPIDDHRLTTWPPYDTKRRRMTS